MKHTVKLLALALALCLALLLAACGKSESKTPTDAGSGGSSPTDAGSVTGAQETQAPPAETEEDDGFEDVVVVDNEYVRIVLVRVFRNEGVNMWFDAENKTDRKLSVGLEDSRIFDYWIGETLWIRLDPGEHKEEYGGFSRNDLDIVDLWIPEQVSGILKVYDMTDHLFFDEDMEPLCAVPVTLYPTGQNAETAVQHEEPRTDNETVMAETDEFTVTFLYGEADPNWPGTGFDYLVRFDNKSDRSLTFNGENLSFNGTPVIFSDKFSKQPDHPDDMVVPAGTHRYDCPDILGYVFDNLPFTSAEVTEVAFDLVVTDETGTVVFDQHVSAAFAQ